MIEREEEIWVEVLVMSSVSHIHSAQSDLNLGGHSSQINYIWRPVFNKAFHK